MPRGADETPALLFSMLLASPAAAHAESVSITRANGTTQQSADPGQMTFTESVSLIDDGVGLERDGAHTDPTVDGHTVSLPMPADLPDGAYV